MADPPTLLSTLHTLVTSLKSVQSGSAPPSSPLLSGYGPAVDGGAAPLTREAVKEAVAGMRDVLERFKGIWEEGGEDGRVRDAGKMKEWTQTSAPLLSLAPTLHHLSQGSLANTTTSTNTSPLFLPSPRTPFALPSSSSPAALIEKTAKALGLEVYRESTVEPSASGEVTTKETLILGGTALAVEIDLTESSASQDGEEGGGWKVAKVRSVVALESGEESLPGVDKLIGEPLEELLALMRTDGEREAEVGEGETRELRAARVLGELERRLREVVRVDRATKGSKSENVFKKAEDMRKGVDEWLVGKDCETGNCSITPLTNPYPTYLVSPQKTTSPRPIAHKQVVHLVPTSAGASPPRPLPAELLALTVNDSAPSDGWGSSSTWEAIFEPALIVGVSGTTNSWGQTLLQQARSLSSPVSSQLLVPVTWETPNSTTPQVWAQAETPPMEGVAISRVAVQSVEEAGRVIEWARAWATLNEFWLNIFDAPPSVPLAAPPIVPLDLDDLEAFLLAPPPILPITLHLLPSSHPSIQLTLAHPTTSFSTLTITLAPTVAGRIKISLDPRSEAVSVARLDALGSKFGGWGQGVVRWVVDTLFELREESVEAVEREKRKREESGEVMGEEEGQEDEERKRVKM